MTAHKTRLMSINLLPQCMLGGCLMQLQSHAQHSANHECWWWFQISNNLPQFQNESALFFKIISSRINKLTLNQISKVCLNWLRGPMCWKTGSSLSQTDLCLFVLSSLRPTDSAHTAKSAPGQRLLFQVQLGPLGVQQRAAHPLQEHERSTLQEPTGIRWLIHLYSPSS